MKEYYRGFWIYASAVFLISVNQAVSKFMVEGLNTFVVMQIRMCVTCTICYFALRGDENQFWGENGVRRLMFARGTLGFIGLCCTYYALRYLSLPDKAALAFLVPLFTIFGANCLIGESLRWQQVMASIVAFIGVAVIARPPILKGQVTEEHRFEAVAASLAFVTVTALGILILRRLKTVNPVAPVANFAVVSLCCSTIIVSLGNYSYPRDPLSWVLLAVTGVLGFAIQLLETKALQYTDASALVNLRYTQLIWATLWEWLLWGDIPDIFTIVGSGLVIGSIAYCSYAVPSSVAGSILLLDESAEDL